MRVIGFILLFSILLGCQKSPEKLPQKQVDTFCSIYIEYLNLVTEQLATTQQRDAILDSVLARHAMSREVFEQTMRHFVANPQEFEPVLARINPELAQQLKSAPSQN